MAKLTLVGLGPGRLEYMSGAALEALNNCDIIAGYKTYIDILIEESPALASKKIYSSGMRGEVERCRHSLSLAQSGQNVCLISSGDSGVYGMASLVLELAAEFPTVKIDIVPGISAALSAGAVIGAPLGGDFAAISLSDLLTPWELIEKRLRAAAAGDFAICLYNPGSKSRPDHLEKACNILLETLPEERPCSIVNNVGRPGEKYLITNLGALKTASVDMFSTVFIGNSMTKIINGKFVTARGYKCTE